MGLYFNEYLTNLSVLIANVINTDGYNLQTKALWKSSIKFSKSIKYKSVLRRKSLRNTALEKHILHKEAHPRKLTEPLFAVEKSGMNLHIP